MGLRSSRTIPYMSHMTQHRQDPTDWQDASGHLKRELERRRLSQEDLRKRLASRGETVTRDSLAGMLSRGTFKASFFLRCLDAIGVDYLPIRERGVPFRGTRGTHSPTQLSSAVNAPSNGAEGYWHSGLQKRFGKFWDSHDEEGPDLPVVSLFTGAGGLDIGLEEAGFRTAVCVEMDGDCRATLGANRPDWLLYEEHGPGGSPGDIRGVAPESLLEFAGLRPGEVALVVGGAPCQPFSNIGKRRGRQDPRNGDLFLEFVRIVEAVRPRGLIFENVKGIAQRKHDAVISYMREHLEALGYSLTWATLNAADYGVPQRRERFILTGLRTQDSPHLPLPTHFENSDLWAWHREQFTPDPGYDAEPWCTVGDALSRIPENIEEREDYVLMNISAEVRGRMSLIGPGQNFHVLPLDRRPNCWRTGKHQGRDTFGRMRNDRPAHTIRTAAYNPSKGQYIHPNEDRGLSSAEMACFQGFPNDWIFKRAGGRKLTLKSAGLQIGNAVPPALARAIGMSLRPGVVAPG